MIRIVSDSSTLYSIKEGRENNIDILPLSVTVDGKTYLENEEIDTDKLVELIKDGGHIATSSQPAVGEVINTFNKYPEDEIINISMADGLSGTYNSACTAKNICENPGRIEVVNSRTLCAPQRYLVNLAAKMAESGQSKDIILEEINKEIETSKSFLIPKDFNYLVRGGRLSSVAGGIASVIKLVPVVTLSEDSKRLTKFTIKRTLKKAVDKICDELISFGVDENHKIYISHACNGQAVKEVETVIKSRIENADIEVYKLGPVFTTQGGPGCISIQTIKKHELLK